jgi:hypothetical protein
MPALALENIALRHQLAVYKRSVQRPNINDSDRIFWLTVMSMLKDWRNALVEPGEQPSVVVLQEVVNGLQVRLDLLAVLPIGWR